MDRVEKITKQLNLKGRGLEIGPSHNPIVPKKSGYNVHVVDHLDQRGLIEKYKNHNVNLQDIEEVDFVWNGESYAELTGLSNHYDWIIASHVIEHTPDLIDFLNDCETILKEDGIRSLVIPDKRFCFDHYRPISSLSKIIDAHLSQKKKPSPGDVAEYYLNVVSRNKNIAWCKGTKGKDRLIHPLQHAKSLMDQVANDNIYHDVHVWCFTPEAFRLTIIDLHELAFTSFSEISFFKTEGCEFYISLRKNSPVKEHDRLKSLKNILNENKNHD